MERPVLNTLLKGRTILTTPMPGAFSQPPIGGAIATIIRKDGPGTSVCCENPSCTLDILSDKVSETPAKALHGCKVWVQDPNVVLLMQLW